MKEPALEELRELTELCFQLDHLTGCLCVEHPDDPLLKRLYSDSTQLLKTVHELVKGLKQ